MLVSEIKDWQISDTVQFIHKHKATKIGLQFPDHLLKESDKIEQLLKQELIKSSIEIKEDNDNKYELYIMADTTFAPCCVDEISGQHVNANVVIHYGWTCCSPTNRIPVFHVLGKQILNIQLLKQLFFEPKVFKQVFASFEKILILYEPHYSHCKDEFVELFKSKDIEFIITQIQNESSLRLIQENKNDDNHEEKKQKNLEHDDQDHFCGFYHDKLLNKKQWNELLKSEDFSIDTIKQKYGVLYIGNDEFDEYAETPSSENSLYLSLLTNFGSCYKFISYNPKKMESFINDNDKKESDNYIDYILENKEIDEIFSINKNERLLSKMLMYRYSLIEKIRNSDIIGIVCATLVVDNYLDIISTLKSAVNKANKKSYMFSIGKINQAKLGNFPEVDIFVIITCPMSFHFLLPVHQQSFFKNLVTPFDIMLALNDNDDNKSFKWTGMYSTDFNHILNHSFKMGGIKQMEQTQKDDNNDTINETQLAKYGKAGGMVKYDAADYMLEKRTWKGVEVASDDLKPSKIEQGLSGIASQYDGEYK